MRLESWRKAGSSVLGEGEGENGRGGSTRRSTPTSTPTSMPNSTLASTPISTPTPASTLTSTGRPQCADPHQEHRQSSTRQPDVTEEEASER